MNAINKHPDAATMMSYVAGALAEPIAAGVAAHAAMCVECRRRIRDIELIGAGLFRATSAEAVPSVKAPAGTPSAVPRRVAPRQGGLLPTPIADKYGLDFDNIAWRPIGEGAWHHRLPLSPGVEGDLRLFKFAPGYKFPVHGHGGAEFTLVLQGTFDDATGHYERGDVQDVDEETEHQPVVGKDGCICLIASDRSIGP
jgi:putative transcriptional regulator